MQNFCICEKKRELGRMFPIIPTQAQAEEALVERSLVPRK